MQAKNILSSLTDNQKDGIKNILDAYDFYIKKKDVFDVTFNCPNTKRHLAQTYVDIYKNTISGMNDAYAKKRAFVAIDWASSDKKNNLCYSHETIKCLLAFRLAYDMQHPNPLSPGFMMRFVGQLDFNWMMKIIGIIAEIVMYLGCFLAFIGFVSPLLFLTIILILIPLDLISYFCEQSLDLNYYYVKEQFLYKCNGTSSSRYDLSDMPDAADTDNPHTDRHLRPYDKMGFFNTSKEPKELVSAIAESFPWICETACN